MSSEHTIEVSAMKKRSFIIIIGIALLAALQFVNKAKAGTAPMFSLPEIHSQQPLSLEKYKGNVIYLDFWASWCGPCRKSLPLMNEVYHRLEDQGFVVIAVNLDENRELGLKFLSTHSIDYPIVFDGDRITPSKYKLDAMPSAYLIDREGNIRATHRGFKEQSLPEIEAHIQALLSE